MASSQNDFQRQLMPQNWQRLFMPQNSNPEDDLYSYGLRLSFLVIAVLYLGVMIQLLPASMLRRLPGMNTMTIALLAHLLGTIYIRERYHLD